MYRAMLVWACQGCATEVQADHPGMVAGPGQLQAPLADGTRLESVPACPRCGRPALTADDQLKARGRA